MKNFIKFLQSRSIAVLAIAMMPMVAFLPYWVVISVLTIFAMIMFWQVTK